MSLQDLVLDPRKGHHHLLLITLGNRDPGPDQDLDPGLGDLDLILDLEFLDPSPNDHQVGLEPDQDRLIAIAEIEKHISKTNGVQEPNPLISIWMNGGPKLQIIQSKLTMIW